MEKMRMQICCKRETFSAFHKKHFPVQKFDDFFPTTTTVKDFAGKWDFWWVVVETLKKQDKRSPQQLHEERLSLLVLSSWLFK